jgi:hypothetical protein
VNRRPQAGSSGCPRRQRNIEAEKLLDRLGLNFFNEV